MTGLPFNRFRFFFWDFDGVVKDSIAVKGNAFVFFCSSFGLSADFIKEYHKEFGGVNRTVKIRSLAELAGIDLDLVELKNVENKFSEYVVSKVIDSPWVKGARECLFAWSGKQALISASPESELLMICDELNLSELFVEIGGYPQCKSQFVSNILSKFGLVGSECLYFGDSMVDSEAAQCNGVNFCYVGPKHQKREFPYDFWIEDFDGILGKC